MRNAMFPLLLLLAGCVPDEIHRQDQVRIFEHMSRIAELQNQVSAVMGIQRILEGACIVSGLLLAVCVAVLWLRAKKKGTPCS